MLKKKPICYNELEETGNGREKTEKGLACRLPFTVCRLFGGIMEFNIKVPQKIRITKKHILALTTVALLVFGYEKMGSETLTLHAYYPSPVGIYTRLVSINRASFARDKGNVLLLERNPTGMVGIGTSNPQAKLDVRGSVKIGQDTGACVPGKAGAIRHNTAVTPPKMEYCDSATNSWKELGGNSDSGWFVVSDLKATDAPNNGDFDGYLGIHTWIQTRDCEGYHVCENMEVVRWLEKGNSLPGLGRWWVSAGFSNFFYDAGPYYTTNDCEGWTYSSSRFGTTAERLIATDPPNLQHAICSSNIPVLCCKY